MGLGTVDPKQGDLRRNKVFITRATSFPNAQKVPALVATLLGELRERMPAAATLREQLEMTFEAYQRLVSIWILTSSRRERSWNIMCSTKRSRVP